jgi:hypothetical protein
LPSGGDHSEKVAAEGSSEKEMPKGDTKTTGKSTLFAPRSVIKPLGWNKSEKADVAAEELKSNDDFRNLLLKK